MTVPSVWRTALRWKMTRSRPSAAARMIRVAMARVTQTAAGMMVPSLSGQEFRDGARVPGCPERDIADRCVSDGQQLRDVVELAGQRDAADEDVVGRPPDPCQRRQDAVEQRDEDRDDDEQKDRVA